MNYEPGPLPWAMGRDPRFLLRGRTAITYKSISSLQVMARSELTKERQQIEKRKCSCPECPYDSSTGETWELVRSLLIEYQEAIPSASNVRSTEGRFLTV